MKFWWCLAALPWISRIAAAPRHSYSVSPKGFILEDGAPMSFTGVNAMHVFGVRQRVKMYQRFNATIHTACAPDLLL